MIKDKIYSSAEDRFINVMDIERIIVEDDENSDIGYFRIIAFLCEGEGWKEFNDDIDTDYQVNGGWTEDGLRNLADIRNRTQGQNCSVVVIGDLHVIPNKNKNEEEMWKEMWKNVYKRARKFTKDIKISQEFIRNKQISDSINLEYY